MVKDLYNVAFRISGDGLRVLISNISEIEECEYKSEFNLQLVIALSKSDKVLSEQFKAFFKKCNPRFSERTLDILHYPYKKGDSLKDIQAFLKSRGFDKGELLNIENIWKAKYSNDHELEEIYTIISTIKNTKSKLKKFSLYNELIEKGKSSDSIFIKNLVVSVGYGKIGNKGLLAENFKKLISINEMIYINDLPQNFVSVKNRVHYYELINELFSMLRDTLEDEKLVRILDTSFHFLDLSGEIIKFESTNFDWSLNEIKENMNTSLYSYSFPSFWMKAVLNRVSNKEQQDFVSRLEKLRVLKKLNVLDFWMFKGNLSPDDKVRNELISSLDSSYGKSIANDYIVLNLMEEPIFKKNLGEKNIKLKRPIFTLKRNHYHKALRDGRETSFPVIKLIEMGEETEDFIWWLML